MLKLQELTEHVYNAAHEGAIVQIKPNEFMVLFDFLEFASEWVGHPGELLLSDFFDPLKERICRFSHYLFVSREQLNGALREILEGNSNSDLEWGGWKASLSPGLSGTISQEFLDDMQLIKTSMELGDLSKAVPITTLSGVGMPNVLERLTMLQRLLQVSSDRYQFIYGLFLPLRGVLGSTPEILFRSSKNRVESIALAGTLDKRSGTSSTLLESAKDLKEHQIVIDRINWKLKKWGEVFIEDTEAIELPHLWHLRTKIQATSKVVGDEAYPSPSELIRELHPTPALGIESDKLNYSWLKQLHHQQDRGCFGAPLTLATGEKNYLSLVAIRNLRWTQGKSFISAGCGVVQESQAHLEWQELATKISSVQKLLGLV